MSTGPSSPVRSEGALTYVPSAVEIERRRRIRLAVAAYVYEVLADDPIMSDAEFDAECFKVDLSVDTGNARLDQWFRQNFDPSTGQWIYQHPDLRRIAELATTVYGRRMQEGMAMDEPLNTQATTESADTPLTTHEDVHSDKGGSSAERWMNCPGSSVLLKMLNLPQTDEPDYRRDGIAAHECAAHCLRAGIDTWEVVGMKFHDVEVDQAMADAVQMYLDDVRQFMGYPVVLVEQRIGSDLPQQPHEDFFGTLDFGAVCPEELVIEDYKHGEGIVVDPFENPQLMYYAYGLILRRIQINRVEVRSDLLVRIRICQPRAFHEDGPIREWETTAGEIIHWGENVLIPAMERADLDTTFDTGTHCRFCPAKLFCPLLASMFGAAMRADATALPSFGQGRLAAEYKAIKAVKFYLKAVEDEVFRRNMLGNTVPDTKLVPKRSIRVFVDSVEVEQDGQRVSRKVADLLIDKLGRDNVMTKPELKSPAEIEKLGPAAKALVSEYAYAPQNGLTVAPASDPKPAVKVEKAVDIFAHLIEAADAVATN